MNTPNETLVKITGNDLNKFVMALLLTPIEYHDMSLTEAYDKDEYYFFKKLMELDKETLEDMFFSYEENDFFESYLFGNLD